MSENKQITSTELGQKLVGLLDGLLQVGDWGASLFLRTSAKRLRDLREEASKIALQHVAVAVTDIAAVDKNVIPQGYIQVYISLYLVDGTNLQTWYRTIKGLMEHVVTRPIYKDESYVREFIRSKTDQERNAYLVANIKATDIYTAEKTQYDVFGHELINLQDKAVQFENIVCFVHANKRRYSLGKDGLIFIGNVA